MKTVRNKEEKRFVLKIQEDEKKVLSFMDMCCCVCPHDSLLSCMVDTKPLGAQRVFPVDRTQMQTLSHISPHGIHMLVNCRGVIHSDTIIMCSGNETHI